MIIFDERIQAKFYHCDRCGSVSVIGTISIQGTDLCRECYTEIQELDEDGNID